MKTNEILEYLEALSETYPEKTDEQMLENAVFVFLTKRRVIAVFWKMVRYSVWLKYRVLRETFFF